MDENERHKAERAFSESSREPGVEVDRVAKAVIGAGIEVHRELGPGYLESVYEAALAIELGLRKIRFQRQAPIPISYKGRDIGQGKIDLLVDNALIVELKTVENLAPIHSAQVISYLKATGLPLGLLMNFNTPVLRDGIKRIALTRHQGSTAKAP